MMGSFTNWNQILGSNNKVNLVNVPYIVMNNFGYQLGIASHLSHHISIQIGIWISRYVGLSMFLALSGAFITLIISPVTQLVEGTPKAIWTKSFTKNNKFNIPVNALIVQCILVVSLILLISFGGKSSRAFFNILVAMTNVAMTIPYLFITYSFLGFKKNHSTKKPFVFYKYAWETKLSVAIVLLTVGLAIVFTIVAPAIDGDYLNSFWMIIGPIIFGAIGYLIFNRYEKLSK